MSESNAAPAMKAPHKDCDRKRRRRIEHSFCRLDLKQAVHSRRSLIDRDRYSKTQPCGVKKQAVLCAFGDTLDPVVSRRSLRAQTSDPTHPGCVLALLWPCPARPATGALFGRTGVQKCKKSVNRQHTVVNYFWQIVAVEIYNFQAKTKNCLQENLAFSA